MYTYSIFSVKPKIATNYFYKTGILYRFIQEFKKNPNYTYLQLQYKYAMNPLDINIIAAHLNSLDIELEKRDLTMKVYWGNKSLTIYEDDRHLEITCDAIEDIEEFLFPILRKSSQYFFVICNQIKDYGWLSVKNHRLLDKQLLYSS